MWQGGTTSVARRGVNSPLTSCPDWAFLGLDLAIENIRACEHRGTMGSLSCAQLVVQSPAPGSVTHNLLIPGSSLASVTLSNNSKSGSCLSRFDRFFRRRSWYGVFGQDKQNEVQSGAAPEH
jgi:hypothetical protein